MFSIPKENRSKLYANSERCTFVGYSETQKASRFWNPVTRKLRVSRDTIFHEKDVRDVDQPKPPKLDDVLFDACDDHDLSDAPQNCVARDAPETVREIEREAPVTEVSVEQTSVIPPIFEDNVPLFSRPQRKRRAPAWMRSGDFVMEQNDALTCISHQDQEPTSYKTALASSNAKPWYAAMRAEYDSLIKLNTWTLVQMPPGRKTIKNRWVFKIKTDQDGAPPVFKARLVAKGYSQMPGIDYDQIFAPVVRHDTIRVILGIIASRDVEALHVDAQNAFLNGDLEEELYMKQPEGFAVPKQEDLVCRLNKSIYGLKQASRTWNKVVNACMLAFDLSQSTSDPCVFYSSSSEHYIVAAFWVDDGLFASNNLEALTSLTRHISGYFKITTKPLERFVGLSINRNRKTVNSPFLILCILQNS